jgi:LPS O-antigen subunit length determinant protein (WzzB/FepE family)
MSAAPSDKTPARDVEPEQEMDLGRIWRSVVARWWLLLVGFVVGAIVGLLVSLGGSKQWKATAEIYLGQPLSTSGSPVTSPPTSLGLATAYINQLAQIKHAANGSGLTVAQLNGALSVKPILGLTGTKIGQPAPLMLLSVTGPKKIGVQLAADDLARQVVSQFQPYTTQKIKIIQARLTQESKQIADINRRLTAAENAQASLATSAANAALVAGYAQIIATLSNERFASQDDIVSAKQAIAQALGIESPRIVSHPQSASQGGPSRRSGVIIGAIIGLVIGLLIAIFWDPVAGQVGKHESEAAA